jgi:hypothetical protein
MHARWVLNFPTPELPGIGRAIIASWWPGRYYVVSTVQLDSFSPIAVLTRSLQQKVPFGKASPGPDKFITQVFKSDKDGMVASFDNPLYEQEYLDILAAQTGHKLVVSSLQQGRLKKPRK